MKVIITYRTLCN